MALWKVEGTQEFTEWFDALDVPIQDTVADTVNMLVQAGPMLPYPYSSAVHGSVYSHMRELRIQHAGRPYRVFYAFDPRRVAILLVGGVKAGQKRFYARLVRRADRRYAEHLRELGAREGN